MGAVKAYYMTVQDVYDEVLDRVRTAEPFADPHDLFILASNAMKLCRAGCPKCPKCNVFNMTGDVCYRCERKHHDQ